MLTSEVSAVDFLWPKVHVHSCCYQYLLAEQKAQARPDLLGGPSLAVLCASGCIYQHVFNYREIARPLVPVPTTYLDEV